MHTIKRIVDPTIATIDRSLSETTGAGIELDTIFTRGSFYYVLNNTILRRNLLALAPSNKHLLIKVKKLYEACGLDKEVLKEHISKLVELFPNLILSFDDRSLLYKMRDELQQEMNKKVYIAGYVQEWKRHNKDIEFLLTSFGDITNTIDAIQNGKSVIIDWGNPTAYKDNSFVEGVIRNVGESDNLYAVCTKPDAYRKIARSYGVKCD